MNTSATAARSTTWALPRVVALVVGLFFAGFGAWAMVAPKSFYGAAVFPPYNQHFLQDIGAFQIGLGAVLLIAALASANGLAVALLGAGVGNAAHTVSHIIGIDLGGNPPRDIPTFAVITLILLYAGWREWRRR